MDKYISAMIIDGTHNDPTIISLDNARIVFNFDKEGNPILTNSILIRELLKQLRKDKTWERIQRTQLNSESF